MTTLLTGQSYAWLQKKADQLVPVGWCVPCVTVAKAAEKTGTPEPATVHAGVTTVLVAQPVEIPGMGTQMVATPVPVCWEHLSMTKQSSVIAANGALPPPPGRPR